MWRAEKLRSVSLGSGLAAKKDYVCQFEGSDYERGLGRSRVRFFSFRNNCLSDVRFSNKQLS